MSTSLAKNEPNALAELGHGQGLTPMQKIGQELALVPGVDEEYQFAMRKLGTIHLGVKVKNQGGREYPKATEYFVLPEQLRNDPDFREKLTEMGQDPDKPQKLPIMFMSDDLSVNIIRCCELWGTGAKLKCRATPVRLPNGSVGLHCIQLNPQTLDYEDHQCSQDGCREFSSGNCSWVTKLRFSLPDQSQIGYWEIITKSDNNKGAIARELRDLRQLLRGQLAGVDLALVLTNERTFHPKVTDRSGKTTRMATQPYLLHVELGKSLRKLMAEGRTGDVIDADIIQDSFDHEDEPIVEETGEPQAAPEEVHEVAEFTAEPEPEPADDPERKEKLLSDTKALCVALNFTVQETNAFLGECGFAGRKIPKMNCDELQSIYTALLAKLEAKNDQPASAPDFDPFE